MEIFYSLPHRRTLGHGSLTTNTSFGGIARELRSNWRVQKYDQRRGGCRLSDICWVSAAPITINRTRIRRILNNGGYSDDSRENTLNISQD
jgi:hypothetical protein